VPWVVAVLTTPAECRWQLQRKQALDQLRRRATEIVKSWAVRWMFYGRPCRVGGAVTVHPEGDERPGVWAPHFNFLIPARALLDDGHPIKGRWHVPVEALDDLREEWAHELSRWGFRRDCDPQIFVEHRHELPQKLHAGRYFARTFPSWQSWAQTVGYFGLLAGRVPELPGVERVKLDPPRPSYKCECGGFMVSIAVRGENGEWIPVGVGPPE
jgi:hypothetical protein